MSIEEGKGSMVDPKDYGKQGKLDEALGHRPPTGKDKEETGYPLFEKMDAIITAIEKQTKAIEANTEATNALITTLVGEVRDKIPKQTPPPLPERPREQTQSEQALPEKTTPPTDVMEKVKLLFPNDIVELVSFEDKGDHIKIKPKQFLGSENFAKIASVVRAGGGEYVSAGRESHFNIKK